jgi:hypothetical protein
VPFSVLLTITSLLYICFAVGAGVRSFLALLPRVLPAFAAPPLAQLYAAWTQKHSERRLMLLSMRVRFCYDVKKLSY